MLGHLESFIINTVIPISSKEKWETYLTRIKVSPFRVLLIFNNSQKFLGDIKVFTLFQQGKLGEKTVFKVSEKITDSKPLHRCLW